jgi:hypothetical protein
MTAPKNSPQFTCQQVVDALGECGGSRVRAAEKLGMTTRCLANYIRRATALGLEVPPAVRNPAAAEWLRKEVEAAHASAPDGYLVKGVSTLHGPEGEVKQQWIKTNVDEERRMKLIQAAVEEACAKIPPEPPADKPSGPQFDSLLNQYTFTDYHMGMLAWWREGGADWDLNIAEEVLWRSFMNMMLAAPAARVGLLVQLGDFLHTDGLVPVTPTNHHVLDADSRFPKIVQTTIRILRRIVNYMLTKHEEVWVLHAEGNHSPASDVWLQQLFIALYENETRCKVINSVLPYYAVQHGKTMLAFHHGHLLKNGALPALLAAQFPEMWGTTAKRYCHTGHRHHSEEKEHPGMLVIQHPTLAARDAYAARGGWYAERAAQCFTYHKEFGQVARNIVTPEMVR